MAVTKRKIALLEEFKHDSKVTKQEFNRFLEYNLAQSLLIGLDKAKALITFFANSEVTNKIYTETGIMLVLSEGYLCVESTSASAISFGVDSDNRQKEQALVVIAELLNSSVDTIAVEYFGAVQKRKVSCDLEMALDGKSYTYEEIVKDFFIYKNINKSLNKIVLNRYGIEGEEALNLTIYYLD